MSNNAYRQSGAGVGSQRHSQSGQDASLFNDADRVVPSNVERRTLTLCFGPFGDLCRGNPAAGDGPSSFANDEERVYEIRLNRILIRGLSATTEPEMIQFQLKGENALPHPLGYGPGEKHPWVYLTGTDFTINEPVDFRKFVLASDIEGRIKIGPDPTASIREGLNGAPMTWEHIVVELLVTYKHFQKTMARI